LSSGFAKKVEKVEKVEEGRSAAAGRFSGEL
jgi:hypothetical protein